MKKLGFTLIEILLVISIIGFISAASVYSLSAARQKAKITKCRADMKLISDAIELSRDKENKFLKDITGKGCSDCACRDVFGGYTEIESQDCIDSMTETFKSIGFPGIRLDPWGKTYLIDENEYERDSDPCIYHDFINSVNCGYYSVPFYVCK